MKISISIHHDKTILFYNKINGLNWLKVKYKRKQGKFANAV